MSCTTERQRISLGYPYAGVSLELSDRGKFCDIFRISGRSFGPNFEFPYMFYTFKLLPQLRIGRSQPAEGDFFCQIAL